MEVGPGATGRLVTVVTEAGGVALRQGAFYGLGADDDQIALVRRRMLPLAGGATGTPRVPYGA